jgi:hypothetical protein
MIILKAKSFLEGHKKDISTTYRITLRYSVEFESLGGKKEKGV